MNFVASAINRMWVVPISGTMGSRFEANYPAGKLRDLDWQPVARQALRQPILAEDCDAYAFLGRNEPGPNGQPVNYFKLWIGQFVHTEAQSVQFEGNLKVGSVAIGRKCRSIIVRDDDFNLHVVSLDKDLKQSDTVSVPLGSVPSEMRRILVPNWPQAQPMLAAAPIEDGGGWRVAWPTPDGLTVVDVQGRNDKLAATLLDNRQMLTGLEGNYSFGYLSLSPDGSFAFMSTQQNFASRVQLEVFDLNLGQRRETLKALANDKLLHEACRVAKFQTGFNLLTVTELEIWLGSRDAPQPCAREE